MSLIRGSDPAGAPNDLPLPHGFGIALDPSVRTYRDGRLLVGGQPLQVVRLSKSMRDAVEQLRVGADASEAARQLGRQLIDRGLAHPRPPASPALDITVVVPVHDRVAELEACLAALDPATPVLVVDDGSADGPATADVCRRYGAKVLRLDRCGGPARARNEGLSAVTTELVAFLDSDCVPPPNWLEPLVAHMGDPAVAIVAPRIRAPEYRSPGWLQRLIMARSPLDMGPAEGEVVPGARVSFVPTAALVFRVGALSDPFSADLRFGEDIDMVWRVRDAGWSVRYEPAVNVRHDGEPSTWRGLLTRRRQYGTSAGPLARRHPGRLAPLAIRPWPTVAALLLLTRRFLPATVVGAAAALSEAHRKAAVGIPARQAIGSSAFAVPQAIVGLGRFATQFCSPLLFSAMLSRRARPAALILLASPPLVEWLRRRPDLDPVRWTIGSVAEDVAYGTGVWIGCIRERTLIPVTPSIAHDEPPGVVDFPDELSGPPAAASPGRAR